MKNSILVIILSFVASIATFNTNAATTTDKKVNCCIETIACECGCKDCASGKTTCATCPKCNKADASKSSCCEKHSTAEKANCCSKDQTKACKKACEKNCSSKNKPCKNCDKCCG